MVAGKIGTAQAQNLPDLIWRGVLGEQFSGQPEIDRAPIRLREAPTSLTQQHNKPTTKAFIKSILGDPRVELIAALPT